MRNKYKINYIGKYSNFASIKNKKAPIYARAGEKVTVCYPLGTTDTKYTFKLDDEILNPQYNHEKGYILSFIMPEHNVNLNCISYNISGYRM